MLAELPVGDPGPAFEDLLKGEGVNEDGLAFPELNIVRAAIFERHPKPKRFPLNLQSAQRRLFELAETPFVGIGDEGYGFGLDDSVGFLGGGASPVDLSVGHEQS